MPRNQIKVDLFGKAGHRDTEVTPQGFPTRHVRTRTGHLPTTEPATITPNPVIPSPQTEKPAPVLPAFTAAYQENRQRLINFLSQDYAPRDLSDGVILHELGEAITAEYAPRTEMTPAQWTALTADLQLDKWNYPHWISALQRKINLKYEGRRSKPITFPDFAPPESDEGEPVKVFYRRDRQKHLIFEGRKAACFDTYVQHYCNEHGISLTAETDDGQRVQFFISIGEKKEYGRQNAEQHARRRKK